MINRRKLLLVVIGVLALTAAVNAGMVSVSQLDAERRQSPRVCGRTDLQHTNSSSPFNYSGLADLDLWSVEFLPEAETDVAQTAQIRNLHSLTNGPSSLNLCLSALIGLGLCSSAHYVKKVSFGFIPEWYHNGGPFQIGHSFAISPESLCPAPVCCFVQTVWAAEPLIPQYRHRAIVSLWRKSQFTLCILASRWPPS